MRASNRILVLSICGFMCTVLFAFIGYTQIRNFIIEDQLSLKTHNMITKFYLKLPMPLTFCVYFFNISNPIQVHEGQKPILHEVGPYCYDSYKEKIDVQINQGEDSLTYTPFESYFFNQERSGNLKESDDVTILHPLIVGLVNVVQDDFPAMMPIASRAIKVIFNNPSSIYLTCRVKDFLFDGLPLNCDIPDYAAIAVCSHLKDRVPFLEEVKKNQYVLAGLAYRNGSLPYRTKVLRGTKKASETGRMLELNHMKVTTMWRTKKCNRFVGTDTWIFPPFLGKTIKVYSSDVCRNFEAEFISEFILRGVPVNEYHIYMKDDEKCYCVTKDSCPPKGFYNLAKCWGVPILGTLPHFLNVDIKYRNQVQGLKPIMKKHVMRVLIQPMLAIPMEAYKRFQINLEIKSHREIALMKKLPSAIHPILWVEESIVLDGSILQIVQSVFIFFRVFAVVKYVLLGINLVGIAYGSYKYYKRRHETSVLITPVHKASSKIQVKPFKKNSKQKTADESSESGFDDIDSNKDQSAKY